MNPIIADTLEESIAVKRRFIDANAEVIMNVARRMADAVASRHKILFFGNGGSAADAQHLAAEFVNRFQIERPPLAAIALTTDTSIITSIGNDYRFEDIFSKQVMALGNKDDVAVGISTSGNSANVIEGIEAARSAGMTTIGMAGRGGRLADICDVCLCVPSDTTARVQEAHIRAGHMICDLVDRILFPEGQPSA